MIFDSLIVEVSLTPAYLLVLLLGLLLLSHVVLIRWLALGDIAWKRIDYVWLGAAFLGIMAASGESQQSLSKLLLDNFYREHTVFTYKMLRDFLGEGSVVCRETVKGPMSPSNFDEIDAEQKAVCAWSRQEVKKLPGKLPESGPTLASLGFSEYPRKTQYSDGFLRPLRYYVSQYEESQRRYAALYLSSRTDTRTSYFRVLGPLLLTFALALRMTKVTADIINSRKPRS